MKRFASIFLQLLCTCFLFSTYQSLFAGFFSVSFNSGAQVFNAEVLTEDRGFIDICEIYRNRKIESISPKNGSRLISKVVDTVQHLDFFLLFLSFHKPEENPQILVLTADQVLCNADGRWIMAKDIVDGTTLFGKTGDVTVTDIGSMRFAEKGDELQTSYSIELADFGQKTPHSFFVKGSSCSSNKAVLVHNGIPSRREYMSPAFDHLRSKYDYLTLFPNKHPCSGGCHSSEFSNDPVAALATLACMGLAAYYGPQGNRPSIDQVLPVMVEPGPQNIDDFGYSDDYVEVAKLRHKNQQIKIQAEQEIQRDAEKKRRAKVLEFRAQQKAQRERKHAEKALAFEKEKRQQEENQKQINVLRYCALKKILEQSQNFFSKRQRELIDSACCYSGLLGCVAAFAGAPAAVAFPMLSISNANIWCRSGTAAARLLCQGYYKMFVGNEKLFETNWKQDCSTLAQHGFWCLLPGLIACASKNLANPLKTLRKNTSKTIIGSAFKKSL
ncbi:hypothetical protein KAU11_01135 [Candidatus Babeliales bacterium]|nr:hypothetical protein [Candidatus Babeliales bacterium]